jgi:hypothetical protein
METVKAHVELYVGAPREGKSSEMAYQVGRDRYGKNITIENQFSLTPKIAGQRLAQGLEYTTFVDMLQWTSRVPQYVNVFESDAPTELERERQDRIIRDDAKAGVYGERNKDPNISVLIDERVDEAFALLQYQREIRPLSWLSHVTEFASRHLGDLIRGCHRLSARNKAKAWFYLSSYDRRRELGPMKRVLDPLGDASIVARCGALNELDIISAYDTILISGVGASSDAINYLSFRWVNAGIRWVELYQRPLTITVDEAANLGIPQRGIFSDRVLNSARLLAKYGLSFRFAIHSPFAVEPSVRQQLIDMARVIKCFRITDPESVEMMAAIMGTPQLSSRKLDYVTTHRRQLHDGYDQVTVRETRPFRTWDSMRDENLTGETISRTVLQPRYLTYDEEIPHYRSTSDQLRFTGQEITMLERQQRWVRDGRVAYKAIAPTLQNPFVFENCLETRVWRFLDRILERPEYQEARIQKPKGPAWQPPKKSGKQSKKQ